MTTPPASKPWKRGSPATRALLIAAQLLALMTFLLALQFLRNTTGGTLFLFSSIGPLLGTIAGLAVLGAAIYQYMRRHSLFVTVDLGPREVIFGEGEEGDCAYFIHSGEVEIVRQEGGVERVVAKLSKGEYFGEMALISNVPRNATARSLGPVRLAVLGKQNFLTMLSVMPYTHEDIMHTVNLRAMRNAEK